LPNVLSLISRKVRLDEVEQVLPHIAAAETTRIVVDMSAG